MLQIVGNHNVAHLHRYYADAPHGGLALYLFLDFLVELVATQRHLGHCRATHGLTHGCLRQKRHRRIVVLDFDASLFGIPHHPEQHSINRDGHKVGCQSFLGIKWRGDGTLVNANGAVLQNGNGEIQPRARHTRKFAHAQHHYALPRKRDMYR